MKLLISVIGFLCCLAVITAIDITASSEPRRICGSKLAEVLSILCTRTYNSLEPVLNELSTDELSEIEMLLPAEQEDIFQFGPHGRFFRTRRGVAEECCFHGCTLEDLLSYCYDG